MAGVLATAPVTISVPVLDTVPLASESGGQSGRTSALADLGPAGAARYGLPLVVSLNRAAADSGEGGGGGEGGGDSGAGGGDSGSGGGGDSGSDGGSGGNSGPGGDDGGGDNSGPGNSDDGGSDDGGSSGSSSGAEESGGERGGGFGDVEQVGPDLDRSEESEAIESGWQ